MCQNSSLEIVSQSKHGYIGLCKGCNRFNLIFENLFILMQQEEVVSLSRMLEDHFGVYWHNNPIGKGKQITMNTPIPNFYIAFNIDEFEEFKTMVIEANLIIEARVILRNAIKNPRK
ncbi:MAG TPA: DUF6686 family protein [Leadbetterella sp.]|nr:DUF6686 family protein [Leadbetterella sp.]